MDMPWSTGKVGANRVPQPRERTYSTQLICPMEDALLAQGVIWAQVV